MPSERLQKIIAAAGICSRRAAEELITAGRVRVNGPTVTELGAKADPEKDEILVDGKPLRRATPHVYLMLNKPRGCVTTVEDPEGRPTVMEFLKRIKERIYPIGRLDFHSEGLLLFTNDGEFANRILSTGFGVNKTYLAKVSGTPTQEELDSLREGVMMDGRRTLPAEIRPLPHHGGDDWRDDGRRKKLTAKSRKPRRDAEEEDDDGNPWFEVVLQEGRQNQIRRMFDLIGHSVRKLRRVRIGRLTLGTLKPGEFRHLEPDEVEALMAGERASESKPKKTAPRKRRTAAEFRETFKRGAEAPAETAPLAGEDAAVDDEAVLAEELVREPAAVASEEVSSPSADKPSRATAGLPADDFDMELDEAEAEEFVPAEPARPRRPFERRPEPAPQQRFDERPQYGRKKFSRQPGEGRPFEKRPYAGQRPERRDFSGSGERRPFERGGEKRDRFSPRAPGGGPARGGFERGGPPRGGFDRQGPASGGYKRSGPPRGEFSQPRGERGGFERRPFERAGGERTGGGHEGFKPRGEGRGPAREGFERKGGDRGGFKRGGFPRDSFPPEKYADGGRPREAGRPREEGERPFRPRTPRPFGDDKPRFERGPGRGPGGGSGRGPARSGFGNRPSREDRPHGGGRPMRPREPQGEGRPFQPRQEGGRPFERRPFAPRSFDDRGPKGPPRGPRSFDNRGAGSGRMGDDSRPPRRPAGGPGRPPSRPPSKSKPFSPGGPRRRPPQRHD